jgi:polyisoprenoid-binding protein YceI
VARFEIDPTASQVWIHGSSSVHPIEATAAGLAGWVEVSLTRAGAPAASPSLAGEVRIAVDRLGSGNPLVDAETRRRVDARRHPEIVGTVSSATRSSTGALAVAGEIAFRGEVRDVAGELSVGARDGRLVVEGEQTFDVRDWGLKLPRLGLLRVHPDVRVRIHVEAVPAG